MTVGVVGLGLIGGSLARAYKKSKHRVLAFDTDVKITEFAMLSGVVDDVLTEKNIGECDLILVAVYPQAAVDYVRRNAPYISKDALVIDCCGTKRTVCTELFPVAEKYGFTYLGGHPMAGTHNSGFKYSRSNMFSGAPMVIVPPRYDDIALLDKVKTALQPALFGSITVSTAEEHDKIIAFTSQLAHIVSNAYIKSPTAAAHKGFSAGSYKDLTRVAWLNPEMWAQLFLENRDNVLFELDSIIGSLSEYKSAIEENDKKRLTDLLDQGRRCKEEVDGR